MASPRRFVPGDRVRIAQDYWDADLVGRTGIVAAYPDGASPQDGCCWVELDASEWKAGVTDGAEVDAASLERT